MINSILKKNIYTASILFCMICSNLLAGTRVAYTRPGLMMKIPTSSNKKAPYLFRTGVSTEFHNFNPFNTAKGAFFETELGRGFSCGFSAVIPGDTTSIAKLSESTYNAPAEFGFHFQQRVYVYNDISVSVGLQDVVFQSDQTSEEMLSLNTSLLSAFVVLSSEKDLGEYKFNTYFGFGTGGLAPIDADTLTAVLDSDGVVIPDTAETNAGVFVGFLMKTPYFERRGGMDIVGEFDGTGVNVGLRIPLTSDYRLNLGFTHMEKLPEWGNRYWSGHPGFTVGLEMAVPRDPRQRVQSGPSNTLTKSIAKNNNDIPLHRDSTIAMANVAVETLRDSMALMNLSLIHI